MLKNIQSPLEFKLNIIFFIIEFAYLHSILLMFIKIHLMSIQIYLFSDFSLLFSYLDN
jgi:hypothetical protein